MILNVKAQYNFIDVKQFTETDTYIINKMLLNNPKISEIYDSFNYETVHFNNSKHDIWNIDLTEKFENNTNALVIKLKTNIKQNPENNKYLVIYQNITKALNSYGYFWIKNNDDMGSMHVSIDYLCDCLLWSIIRDINIWPKIKYNNAVSGIPRIFNIIELENIYKEYIETYRCSKYDKWLELSKQYNSRYKIC